MNVFDEAKLSAILLRAGWTIEKSVKSGTGEGSEINTPLELLLKIGPAIKQKDKNLGELKKILQKLSQDSNGKLMMTERQKIERLIALLP